MSRESKDVLKRAVPIGTTPHRGHAWAISADGQSAAAKADKVVEEVCADCGAAGAKDAAGALVYFAEDGTRYGDDEAWHEARRARAAERRAVREGAYGGAEFED